MATIETPWRDLAAALEGEIVLPGSARYDEVRRPQIPRFHDVRPRAVVLCRTPEDVVEAIAVARRSGIEVAVRSGGHDFAGRSSGPGMVLDLTPMHSLEVSDGLATVGPGFRLGDLYPGWPNTRSRSRPAAAPRSGSAARCSAAGLDCWAAAAGSRRTS
jgi:FAD binding domain